MPGAEHFRDCEVLVEMIKEQKAAGRFYAAICASPAVVLEHHGILNGSASTSHPAFQDRLANQGYCSSPSIILYPLSVCDVFHRPWFYDIHEHVYNDGDANTI
jgi:putative intracellular protease/amidase